MTLPFVRQGRWWTSGAERELFITANVVDIAPSLRLEDSVTLKQTDYARPWRVIGQTGSIALPQGYGELTQVARVIGIPSSANLVVVKTEQHDTAFQTLMNERLKDHFHQLNMPISYSRAKNSLVQSAEAQLNIVITLLILMALLIGVVGGLGLATTMGLNVLERTREIGILRSLGAKNHVVWYMVIAEGELASLVSFLIAILLSIPVSLGLGAVIGQQIILRPLDYTFSWMGMVIWLFIILVIALLASLLPASNAVRLTIRETLAYTG
jgi:putative ABC transport system permease protein